MIEGPGSFNDTTFTWDEGVFGYRRGVGVSDGSAFENDVHIEIQYSLRESDGLQQSVLFEVNGVITDSSFTVNFFATGSDGVDSPSSDGGSFPGILGGIGGFLGGLLGDPHLISFDTAAYDFQASGDFILTRATAGPAYEVQARFAAISSAVSVTEAIATQVGNVTVSLEIGEDSQGILRLDDTITTLADGETISVDIGLISRSGRTVTIENGLGDRTFVDVYSSFLNVRPSPSIDRAAGTLEGLLGNANGITSDDLQLADGTILTTPVPVDVLYGAFAEGWIVAEADNLLPGEAEEYAAPDRILTIDSLPAVLRDAAEAAVDAAGITNSILRDAAILDFALTGNFDFIDGADQFENFFDPTIATTPIDIAFSPGIVVTTDQTVLSEEIDGEQTATITVSRADSAGDLTIGYNVTNALSADVADTDFTQAIGNVTILDGEVQASFTVTLVDDDLVDDEELFDVGITLNSDDAQRYEILQNSVRLTANDDDVPTIVVTADRTTLSEEIDGERTATITVSRTDTVGDLVVGYDVVDVLNASLADADFAQAVGDVTILDGELEASFTVTLNDDDLVDDGELFDVGITLNADDASRYEVLEDSVRLTANDSDVELPTDSDTNNDNSGFTLSNVNDWFNPEFGGGFNVTFDYTVSEASIVGDDLFAWTIDSGYSGNGTVVHAWTNSFNGPVNTSSEGSFTIGNVDAGFQPELQVGDSFSVSFQVQGAGFDLADFTPTFNDRDPEPVEVSASDVSIDASPTNDWGSGFQQSVNIGNLTSDTIEGWSVVLDVPDDDSFIFNNVWGAEAHGNRLKFIDSRF